MFRDVFPRNWPLIGVVHLPPLPGFPGFPGMKALVEHAMEDLVALEAAGFDGILIENENDQPHNVVSPGETTAAMTEVTGRVVDAAERVVVGAEILLNDPKASLAVALAAGARFIRTDYFVDRMARDEYGGEMAIDPDGLLAYREKIGASQILILADVQVKYARMLESRPLTQSVHLAFEKGADGVIVTGNLTGTAPITADLELALSVVTPQQPILIGSGLTAENADVLLPRARGAIVGTGIMTNGKIDWRKALKLSEIVAEYRVRWAQQMDDA